MGGIIQNLILKSRCDTLAHAIMWCYYQYKGNIYFTLPQLSATKILMCNCHVDKSTVGRYDMILGIYLLKSIVLNLKLFEHVIKVDYMMVSD